MLLTSFFGGIKVILDIFIKYFGKFTQHSFLTIEDGNEPKINSPIVISNHVNWIDIMYLSTIYYPLSFVSK